MKPANLKRALYFLQLPIPRPAPPKRKEQASWATLKPGQRLRSLERIYLGVRRLEAGVEWEVVEVSSLGAELRGPSGERLKLGDKEWKRRFSRVPKRRSKKVRDSSSPPR